MALWLILAAMTAVALAAIIVPLLREKRPAAERSAYDLEIYRDQLSEVERDLERGMISAGEAKAARAEIGRRVLAAAPAMAEAPPPPTSRARELAPILIAAAMPISAFMIYLSIGAPGLTSQPFAKRPQVAEQGGEAASGHELSSMVDRLTQRLRDKPDDVDGWILLGRSYQTLNRHDEAAEAWRRAIALSPDDPGLQGMLGETLVMAANGVVTPEAIAAFQRTLAANPRDPRAQFYLGIAQSQAGDARGALQAWVDLIATSPSDAPWLAAVEARIKDLAAQAKIDPASIKPSSAALAAGRPSPPAALPVPAPSAGQRGPTQADVEAAQRMSGEDRMAMIRSMVESLAARLETQPNDLEGWRRLGRAYKVLNERDKARAAYARAAELAPQNVEVLMDYAGALVEPGPEERPLAPELVAVMRKVLTIEPGHNEALWFVGLAAAQAGNRAEASSLWERLIQRLPPGSTEHARIKQRLDQLKAAN